MPTILPRHKTLCHLARNQIPSQCALMAVWTVSGLALDARDPRRALHRPVGCAPAVADSSESVDPAVEAARFAGEDVWIAERVGEQRASLIRGDEAYREVMGVAPAQCPELLLGPL